MRMLRSSFAVAGLSLMIFLAACSSSGPLQPEFNKSNNPEAIKRLLQPAAAVALQDGIAAAILLDTTGSMKDEVQGTDRKPKPKIEVARMALLKLLQQFSTFAQKNPDKKILVGIYEFSTRPNQPSCRQIVPIGAPDLSAAHRALGAISAEGATPIGDAMITAKRDLDATGFSHRHILVITDGENNRGYMPADVAKVISQEPEAARAAIYFIAFDIGAELFEPVRDAGGLVLAADGEQQLTDTLDFILTGKILVEQPTLPPQAHPIPRIIKK